MATRKISKNYKGKNPNLKKKKERQQNMCPVCGAPIKCLPIEEMNFREIIPTAPKFYFCCSKYPACDTYTSMNPKTNRPNGTLAGPSLRHKRICIHQWENILIAEKIHTKDSFRSTCSYVLGIPNSNLYHTKDITEMQCDSILAYLKNQYENSPKLQKIMENHWKYSTVWKELHGLNTGKNHGVLYTEDGRVVGNKDDMETRDYKEEDLEKRLTQRGASAEGGTGDAKTEGA